MQAILFAWHERQISGHLAHLAEVGDHAGDPAKRLPAVLEAYAFIARQRHDPDLAVLLHWHEDVARARQHLHGLVRDLLTEGVAEGLVRRDVPVGELADYCLHALNAAGDLGSRAAVRRLVMVTLDGLRP